MSGTMGYYAFHGYAGAMNGVTHDGKKIPKWEDLGEKVQNAWECSAMVVAHEIANRAAVSWNLSNVPTRTK